MLYENSTSVYFAPRLLVPHHLLLQLLLHRHRGSLRPHPLFLRCLGGLICLTQGLLKPLRLVLLQRHLDAHLVTRQGYTLPKR